MSCPMHLSCWLEAHPIEVALVGVTLSPGTAAGAT
jgi:hypothetical protein